MNFVQLKKDKLDVNAVNELVTDESCGAISLFVGTTRDNFEDKKVLTLEYEAFEPMATKMMTKICEDLRSKWPDIYHIAIFHRLGIVPVKEASVIIAISSPHRDASLQSVREAIELLKKSVPIWKKEIYDGDEATWKENKESSPSTNPVHRPIKRPKLNFDACIIETPTVAKNLIQISADDLEVSRRIHCFVEKKRDEIDLQNISCFTEKPPELSEQEENSCARVNSIVFKQKDFNGHLRVHRVKNEVGPQVKPDYTNTLNKLMAILPMSAKIKHQPDIKPVQILSHGLEERLNSIEQFLGYNSTPAPRNVYERVKNIEDRLLFLESVSPEYYHFLGEKTPRYAPKKCNRKTYSIQELDQYIEEIKKSNL